MPGLANITRAIDPITYTTIIFVNATVNHSTGNDRKHKVQISLGEKGVSISLLCILSV